MYIWIISSLGLLKIKLLWAFISRSLYDHMPSFILGKYMETEWLDHLVGVCLTFYEMAQLFSKVFVLFHSLTSHV